MRLFNECVEGFIGISQQCFGYRKILIFLEGINLL